MQGKKIWQEEIIAGLIGYLTMVYIIIVNGSILSEAGISMQAGMIATILVSFSGTLFMSVYAKLPLILIPGMGINALFTYSIVLDGNWTYNQGLAVVFVAGILFIVVAFTSLGKLLNEAIAQTLKIGISVGLGFFLIILGFESSGIVVQGENGLLSLGDIRSGATQLSLLTLIIALILYVKNTKAHFLITLVVGTVLAFLFGHISSNDTLDAVNFSLADAVYLPDFSQINTLHFWLSVFSLTMILVFEVMGVLQGQLAMLKREDAFQKGYQAIAISSLFSALFGSSPTISGSENAANISAKGRTYRTSLVASALFLLTLFILPYIGMIPKSATSAILVLVGMMMVLEIKQLPFDDLTEVIPALVIITVIPFTYSIADGMAFGFITYAVLKLATKRYRDLNSLYLLITALFVLMYILKLL